MSLRQDSIKVSSSANAFAANYSVRHDRGEFRRLDKSQELSLQQVGISDGLAEQFQSLGG